MINQMNNISSPALTPQSNQTEEYKDVFYRLEQAIGADVRKVNLLMQNGVITQQQGQYLLAQLAGKAQQINMYKSMQPQTSAPEQSAKQQQMPQNTMQPEIPAAPQETPMAMFDKERPGFFDEDGRSGIREYLNGYEMDKDEILRIASLVEGLENSAVDKYLKKSAHDKSLNDENENAKKKLTAYAQNSPANSKNNRIFTREEIGNMSGDEFVKNEKLIMDQVKQGLIK